MTGDEQFDLQESLVAEVDRNPHDNVSADIRMTFKAAWLASRHETVEEIVEAITQAANRCDSVHADDYARYFIAAIRARFPQ